ncbi:Ankyrin repeat [Diplonema papillatum]|nr:Ankyrin repeat [Diplonema papillatum]
MPLQPKPETLNAENQPKPGADPTKTDCFRKTPLHYAAATGCLSLIELLLAHGAPIDGNDRDCRTPLAEAVDNGVETAVHHLLRRGASAAFATNAGSTPLHLAAAGGNESVVRLLLLHDAAGVSAKNEKGETPLHRAVSMGHAVISRLLVERGADPADEDASGTSCLLLARKSDPPLTALLLHRGQPTALRRRVANRRPRPRFTSRRVVEFRM